MTLSLEEIRKSLGNAIMLFFIIIIIILDYSEVKKQKIFFKRGALCSKIEILFSCNLLSLTMLFISES